MLLALAVGRHALRPPARGRSASGSRCAGHRHSCGRTATTAARRRGRRSPRPARRRAGTSAGRSAGWPAITARISHLKPSGDRLRWGRSEVEKWTVSAMLRSYMALMKPAVIPEFFARLKKAMPEPETELEYENVYHLLVAVVLSAQATDVGVNRATGPLFKVVKTPAADAGARREEADRPHQDHRPVPHQGQERHRACRSC